MKIHPNIIVHMTLSGAGGGAIGGVLSGLLLSAGIVIGGALLATVFGSLLAWEELLEATNRFVENAGFFIIAGSLIGGLIGGGVGLLLGSINGLVMRGILHWRTSTDAQRWCQWVPLLTVPLLAPLQWSLDIGVGIFFTLIPGIVMTVILWIATRRYFAQHLPETRKRKEKPA